MKTYFPGINLLRGIAATIVCIYHFVSFEDVNGPLFSKTSMIREIAEPGSNGVYIFFVISGFVIPLSLFNNKFKINQLHRFLWKRFLRIEIPYLASILLILFVSSIFSFKNNTPFEFYPDQFFYHLFYLIPFTSYPWYNVIYWTLAIEFQFYLIIALLFFLLNHRQATVRFISLLLFGLTGFVLRDERFIFHFSAIFSSGIALAMYKMNKLDKRILIFILLIDFLNSIYLNGISIALFSITTALAIQFVQIDRFLSNQFGEISYSLYLIHGLTGGNFIYLTARYCHSFTSKILVVLAALFISFIAAWIFRILIEKPSQQLSKRIRLRQQTS